MNRQITTTAMLCALLFTGNAEAGPFGLEKGMPLEALGVPESEISSGYYHYNTLPKPHSAFEAYVVQATPNQGVCWVKAIGVDVATDARGTQFVSAFEEMRSKLQRAYGSHDLTNGLPEDAVWTGAEDFMASIYHDERIYLADWGAAYGSELEDNVVQIGLLAEATDYETGYYTVEYYFDNHELCDAETAASTSAAEDDAL